MDLQEAYREMAQACSTRARERDEIWGDRLVDQAIDHERRSEIARLLGVSQDHGCETPAWPVLMTRLRECLTTYRMRKVPT